MYPLQYQLTPYVPMYPLHTNVPNVPPMYQRIPYIPIRSNNEGFLHRNEAKYGFNKCVTFQVKFYRWQHSDDLPTHQCICYSIVQLIALSVDEKAADKCPGDLCNCTYLLLPASPFQLFSSPFVHQTHNTEPWCHSDWGVH